MATSTIEWTQATWNPVTGCDKVSPGCAHCYAEVMAHRLQAMGQANYANGFAVTLQPHMLDVPRRWTRGRRIFVNSMSDLFHDAVPLAYLRQVFAVMEETPQHQYQILTKRSARLRALAPQLPWPRNVWMGVSVESCRWYARIHDLATVPAAVRFLSCEPLLGPLLHLPLAGMQWVIVGGESGQGARPMAERWVQDIRQQCEAVDVPFFFKQWGGRHKATTGRVLNGQTYDAYPLTDEEPV